MVAFDCMARYDFLLVTFGLDETVVEAVKVSRTIIPTKK